MSRTLVRRFNLTERAAHWANALGFLTCLTTGVMMALKERLGLEDAAVERTLTIHLVGAGVFVIAPLCAWLMGHTPSLFRWIGGALRWTFSDIVWLFFPLFKVFIWRLRMPQVDRFNAGQKINMIGMAVLKWTLLVSGLQMWLGHGSLLAFYVHLSAFFLTLPLLAGHLFMAVINPRTNHSVRGMTTGWVREDWAKHHHGAWVARMGDRLERRYAGDDNPDERVIEIPAQDPAWRASETEVDQCESG